MNPMKLGAILLIVAGTLGLVYGTFSYNRQTQHTSFGPIQVSVSERRIVNVPIWAGVGAILVGAVLLLVRRKGET